MTGIVEFLTARLDEDEAAALATTPVPVPGCWKAARDKHAPDDASLFLVQGEDEYEPGSEEYSGNSPVIAYSAEWQPETEADLRHIARHDPARVLREVAAKRAMLREIEAITMHPADGQADPAFLDRPAGRLLRAMASAHADHPDYEQAWAVE